MGTNSKTAHHSYTVVPSAPETWPPTDSKAEVSVVDIDPQGMQHLANAQAALAHALLSEADGDDLVAQYAAFAQAIAEARQHLTAAEAAGAPAELLAALDTELKQAAAQVLASYTDQQLQEIAAANGFTHPTLVGIGLPPHSPVHPLLHWLDPNYPPDTPSKAKIQAKAEERYAALCAGEEVAGTTLAALHDLEVPSPTHSNAWTATPAQVDAALHDATQAQHAYQAALTDPQHHDVSLALAELIAAENNVTTAQCLELGTDLQMAKAQLHAEISSALGTYIPASHLEKAVQNGVAGGVLFDPAHSYVLTGQQTVALLRLSTPQPDADQLAALAEQRLADIAVSKKLSAEFTKWGTGGLVHSYDPLSTATIYDLSALSADPASAIPKFAADTAAATQAQAAVSEWAAKTPIYNAPENLTPPGVILPTKLTADFREWAKGQKLGELRQIAEQMGLDNAVEAKTPRAQVEKFMAAHWDSTFDKATIKAQVAAAHAAKSAPVTKPVSSPAVAASPGPTAAVGTIDSAAKSGSTAATSAATGGFATQHRRLLDALAHTTATAADLPAWLDSKTVQSHDFGVGQAANLGGMHAKSLHTGPDGGQWLFKPDNQAKGARAHAEAAASQILNAGGVPSVPVYVTTAAGKPGTVQPLIKGATHLSTDTKNWTQPDVDAMVRYHVAAWAVGDHDGKHDNILRTPSGGMVPIDQGQAFKFYGQDKLDMAYHPNASYGQARPVFHQAYEAHLTGELAKGVKINPLAAHPVIKAYEAIPDSQWRAMLHTTAHEGAKSGSVAWIPTMRARAAKQHGISESQVSTTQIANAFLDYAVTRKNTLREAFTDFFSTQLKLPSAIALKHGH